MEFLTKNQVKQAVFEALEEKERTNPEQLYSLPQVAKKLNKDYHTIRRMINQGRLQATTDGKYVSQKAIDNYLNLIS